MRVDEILSRLSKDAPPSLGEGKVAEFGSREGIKLPPALRDILCRTDCAILTDELELQASSMLTIGAGNSYPLLIFYGIEYRSDLKIQPLRRFLENVHGRSAEGVPPGLFVFAEDGHGGPFVANLKEPGDSGVLYFDHEVVDDFVEDCVEGSLWSYQVAPSIEEMLEDMQWACS